MSTKKPEQVVQEIVGPIARKAVADSLVEFLPDALRVAIEEVQHAPINVKITMLRPSAKIPARQTEGSSGYDLYYAPPEKTLDANGATRTFCVADIRPNPADNQPGLSVSQGVVTLYPGNSALLPTGIAIAIPPGFEAQIRPRSGLACKGLIVQNSPGTIDSDYRVARAQPAEVKVLVTALNNREPIMIKSGDRIAQLVFAQSVGAAFTSVSAEDWVSAVAADAGKQARGGGFGSTG